MHTPAKSKRPKAQSVAWEIVGYNSLTPFFRAEIPVGKITRNNVEHLLRALTAKHGLNDTETAASFLKRGVNGRQPHLEIQRSKDRVARTTTYSCGSNPHFVARVRRDTTQP